MTEPFPFHLTHPVFYVLPYCIKIKWKLYGACCHCQKTFAHITASRKASFLSWLDLHDDDVYVLSLCKMHSGTITLHKKRGILALQVSQIAIKNTNFPYFSWTQYDSTSLCVCFHSLEGRQWAGHWTRGELKQLRSQRLQTNCTAFLGVTFQVTETKGDSTSGHNRDKPQHNYRPFILPNRPQDFIFCIRQNFFFFFLDIWGQKKIYVLWLFSL